MRDIISKEHSNSAYEIQRMLATYRKSEDLISVGAYKSGSNPETDKAINKIDSINKFLMQSTNELISYDETVDRLIKLAN